MHLEDEDDILILDESDESDDDEDEDESEESEESDEEQFKDVQTIEDEGESEESDEDEGEMVERDVLLELKREKDARELKEWANGWLEDYELKKEEEWEAVE